MSGLTLPTIREALAAQLKANIARDVTVRAYPPAAAGPSITIRSASDFLDYWVSFSAAGLSTVRFDLVIDPGGADLESALRRLDDFLSAGTGNGSSVLDAVLADLSLGIAGATTHIQGASADSDSASGVVTVEVHVMKNEP